MTVKACLATGMLPVLLCFFLCGCGPFVVTETDYDGIGEVGSETVEYGDGGAPRVLSESGDVPDTAISNAGIPEGDDLREEPNPE